MIEAIEIITKEISNITIPIVINATIIIGFWWFLSKFAKSTIPRLIWLGLGTYLLLSPKPDVVLYDVDTMVGIGIVLPHIKFFFEWIYELYEELKRVTIDTYVFGLTIYYKVRNFFLWFYDTYKKIYNFFTKKKNSEQEQRDYYQEQQKQEYQGFKQDSSFYDRAKQRKEQREEEEGFSEQYEEEGDEQQSYNNSEEAHQEQESEENAYKEEKTYKEPSLEEQLKQDGRYKHLFSQSNYTILGVSVDDDLKTIKKAYRKLAQEYHPDKHLNEKDRYDVLFKQVNNAYQAVHKHHK